MKGCPLGPGGEDITWPDQVAPRGPEASSTGHLKRQTPNLHGDQPEKWLPADSSRDESLPAQS